MGIDRYTNNAQTTLNGAINNSTQTVTVTDASTFPSDGIFDIIIDSEIITVPAGGVSGNTFSSCTRGAGGTSAASHSNGATVTHIQTSRAVDQRFLDQISVGAYASLPSENKAGRLYIPTDGYGVFYNNGSGWLNYSPWGVQLYPPSNGSFSWINQGTSTITQVGSGLALLGTGVAGVNTVIRAKTLAASSNYTCRVLLWPSTTLTTSRSFGVCLLDNTNKAVTFGCTLGTAAGPQVFENYLNSPTSYSSTPGAVTAVWPSSPMWFQIHDDGSSRILTYSTDGQAWFDVFQQTRTDFITPTKIGFYVDADAGDCLVTCLSFNET